MAISYVQRKSKGGTAVTTTVTIDSPPTAGSMLALAVSRNLTLGPLVTSITGGGVTTWARAYNSTHTFPYGAYRDSELWYGLNSSGASSDVAITFAVNNFATWEVVAAEFSGLMTTETIIDVTADPTAYWAITGNPSVPITPTAGSNYLLLATAGSAVSISPTTGTFTDIGSGGCGFGYQIVSAASGTYTATWTGAAYQRWTAGAASFKEPASGSKYFFGRFIAGRRA